MHQQRLSWPMWSLSLWLLSCTEKTVEVPIEEVVYVDNDSDGYNNAEDCDDFDFSVNPLAEEVCDGVDNNCNGEVDEGVSIVSYADTDHDGFGDENNKREACFIPEGYVPSANDCDDINPLIFMGSVEVCNDIDDDCDGDIDEDLIFGLYFDGDGDGYGDPNLPSTDCAVREGYVAYGNDCDDLDATIHPFQLELCNDVDDDCDGDIDEDVGDIFFQDADSDGYGVDSLTTRACTLPIGYSSLEGDCDDADSMQYPFADEYCNGEDDNCDGDVDENPVDSPIWYYDIDSDGYGSNFIIALECLAPPGFVSTNTDCDDTKPTVYPRAIEYCDYLDNDCNGVMDDNAVNAFYWFADFDRDNYGNSADVLYQCDQPFDYILDSTDCDDSNNDIHPGADEYCNDVDDDCDGVIDNSTVDQFAYHVDSDGDGYGDPQQVQYSCANPQGYVLDNTDCDDGDNSVYPGAQEFCDGIDQNCNGNNFYEQDINMNGRLACAESVWFRNNTANPTDPTGALSQAAGYLVNSGLTISQYYHGNNYVTYSLLQNYGIYVHHGSNSGGAIRAYTNAEANALATWVRDGGRLLYIGYSADTSCDITDSIPSQFGITCTPNNPWWSGSTNTFVSHPITNGLTSVGAGGGENWSVHSPATTVITISGHVFLVATEYGAGKVVLVSNETPFYNSGTGYGINFADNAVLVQNIWDWLLE